VHDKEDLKELGDVQSGLVLRCSLFSIDSCFVITFLCLRQHVVWREALCYPVVSCSLCVPPVYWWHDTIAGCNFI